MKKQILYNLSIRLMAISILFLTINNQSAAQNRAHQDPFLKIVAGPYLQHVTQTSITIMWETNLPASSVVEYGEQDPLNNSFRSATMKTIHEIVLTALKPQTNYHYRVISSDSSGDCAASDCYTFQTSVKERSPFSFIVIGDSRTYPLRFKRISELLYSERPNFVLHLGDVVSNGNIKSQWINEYLDPASCFMHYIPTYVAIGNHERNSHWYYDYVSYPDPENYYSFCYGNAEFFIVDTNIDFKKGSKQYIWLEHALSDSKAKWKFVAHHHPLFSSDSNDYGNTKTAYSTLGDTSVRKLASLYERHDVDIVWYGHIHTYERTWPIKEGKVDLKDGVIYIQAGGGGAELEEFAPTRSWFTAKILRNWHYCLVNIFDNVVQIMCYDIDGKLYDFLELKK